jgi:hypothetical protein
VALFNMRCDLQQIPESLDGVKLRLFRARATFSGKAAPWNEGSPGLPTPASSEGTAVVGIGPTRVVGILTPDLEVNPSVWFHHPLRGMRVVSNGQQGMLKKRPISVHFGNEDWQVKVSGVNLIIPASGGRQQANQEQAFLDGLKP